MERRSIGKPQVVVEDIITTAADAIVIIPGVSLGGVDLSSQLMKKAGFCEAPACEPGGATILPAGELNAKHLIIGRALPLGDGKGKESAAFSAAMRSCLERARAAEADTVAFACIPTEVYNSRLFSVLTMVWKSIVDSQCEFSMPQTARIVCQNNEIARYYRMVYNYWHAAEKQSRLDDESWD